MHKEELTELFLDQLLDRLFETAKIRSCEEEKMIRTLPIVIYGAGDLGAMAIELMGKCSVTPLAVLDRNECKRGSLLNGIMTKLPIDIERPQREKILVVICVVTASFEEIRKPLIEEGWTNIIHFYDLTYWLDDKVDMSNGWRWEQVEASDEAAIRYVYRNLNDNKAKAHYLSMLYWRIHREEVLFEKAPIIKENKFFPQVVTEVLTDAEVFIDGGAYTGNTLEKIIGISAGKFKRYIAYEPDVENFERLKKLAKDFSGSSHCIELHASGLADVQGKFSFVKRGLSSKFGTRGKSMADAISLETALQNARDVTFIKLHLEGLEYKALQSGMPLIQKLRPIITVTLYHTKEGLYEIPKFIIESLSDYRFYHYVHMHCAQSSVFYAVPEERYKMIE